MKITIDAGHVENYNGGAVRGYYEGNKMFNLAIYLCDELRKYGVEVVHTRYKVTDNPSLAQRGQIAIDNGSDMFISLHSNAFDNPSACGVTGFYSIKRPDSKGLLDVLLHRVMQTMRADTGNTYNRGAQTRKGNGECDYYGVIRSAVASGNVKYAFIIEHGFHSNPSECAWLIQENNLKKLAAAEAAAIAEYFGLNAKPAPAPVPVKPAPVDDSIKVGSVVKIIGNKYYTGVDIPLWVKAKNWIVASVKGDRVVIDKSEDSKKSICSPININSIRRV